MEPEESLENGRALGSQQYIVPDIDLWVPTRLVTNQSQREGTGCYLVHPAGPSSTPDTTQSHHKEGSTTVSAPEISQLQMSCETQGTVPKGVQFLRLPDTHLASMKDPACKVGPSAPEYVSKGKWWVFCALSGH